MNSSFYVPFAFILTIATPLTAHADYSERCPQEEGYYYTNNRHSKNPVEGGFISYDAEISDDIWVGKNAAVCGFATVTNRARILGRSIICGDAQVMGKHAKITGYAKICGDAVVDGTQNEVTMKGYFETDTGLYDSGSYPRADKAEARLEAVERLLEAINGRQFSFYVGYEKQDLRGLYHTTTKAAIPNKSYPCNIEINTHWKIEAMKGYESKETEKDWEYKINLKNIAEISDTPSSPEYNFNTAREKFYETIFSISTDENSSIKLTKKLKNSKQEDSYLKTGKIHLRSNLKSEAFEGIELIKDAKTACSQ
nr:hypothetical protein [uncultured Cohaesibacter sp.]